MKEKSREKAKSRGDNQDAQGAWRCEHCGCETCEDVLSAALWSDRGLLAIEDIPARVCHGCGEQFYEEKTARKIERVIADPAVKARQEIPVPVFSLAEVEVPGSGTHSPGLDEEEMAAAESMFTGMERGSEPPGANRESEEAFACGYCESKTCEEIVKSAVWGDRGLVAIEDIPGWVCPRCGEQFYDGETARKIARLTEPGFPAEKPGREILVPVFSLAEVEVEGES